MVRVESDEPIRDGQLIVNGAAANLMKNADGAYWAKWTGADTEGRIEVHFLDGQATTCEIAHLRSEGVVQTFKVANRRCFRSPD